MTRGEQNLRSLAGKFADERGLTYNVTHELAGIRAEFIAAPGPDGKRLFMASTLSWLEVYKFMKPEMESVLRQWEAAWANRDRWSGGK